MRWEFVSKALSLFLPVFPCLFRLHSRILRFHPRPRYPQDLCGCKIRRNKNFALNLTFLLNSRIISKAAPLDLQWRHKWRTNDQPIKRGTDEPNDRSTVDQTNDQTTGQNINKIDRTHERATEQPSNRATEQPSNRTTEQPSNRATEQSSNRATEQPSNRTIKRTSVSFPNNPYLPDSWCILFTVTYSSLFAVLSMCLTW